MQSHARPLTLAVLFFTAMALSSSTASADTTVIDSFDYSSAQAARRAWQPSSSSPPVGVTRRPGDGKALQVTCDLGEVSERVYYDKAVNLDLSACGRVELWVYADRPGTVRGTVYFQSAGGWYAGGFSFSQDGWHKVAIDRPDFRREESPAGWDQIKKVRLSFWKSGMSEGTLKIAVDQLQARSLPLVVVSSDSRYASRTADLLDSLGVEFMQIPQSQLTADSLKGAELAILPHNAGLPDSAVQGLCSFLDRDGKALLFYRLPRSVAEHMGLEVADWLQQEYSGQFASVRLDKDILEGAPETLGQDSWNVRTARPAAPGARVVGTWVDGDGKDTGIPAVVLAPGGLFMGHVLTSGHDAAKRRFLAAAIAAVLPGWKDKLARTALEQALHSEAVGGFEQCRAFLEANRPSLPSGRYSRANTLMDNARKAVRAARKKLTDGEEGAFAAALDVSASAGSDLRNAIFMSFPSWRPDFRGMWCHSAYGVSGWSWDKAARHAKEMGFNALVVNMLRAGVAHYPSDVLPVSDRAREQGDQIAQCLQACRKHGLELHVWKVNFNLGGAPRSFVQKMRRQNRLQANRQGEEIDWLDPSHPENLDLERESLLEIVRKYDVDGIHFDYIRYPHSQASYAEGTRRRFEKDTGVSVDDWPEDVVTGPLTEKFLDWRAEQVTRLVRKVSRQAREIRPGVEISAAVFRDYPQCRRRVGQDWLSWVENGYLDFLCPMDYYSDNSTFQRLAGQQIEQVAGRIPVYPGLGPSARYGPSPIQTAQQLMIARDLGAPGFMIFNYDTGLVDEVMPGLRKGVLADK